MCGLHRLFICWSPITSAGHGGRQKKLGFNNPVQVKTDDGYDKIADYWNGKIKIPLQVDYYKSLMKLATNTNIKYNIFHPDVVDAMIRQPFSTATKPFMQHTISNGSVIKAVDYDLGRNGYAYYDLDTANYRVSGKPGIGNKGGTYRNDGVDIFRDETKKDFYVGSIETGEWLQYTVNVASAGTYNVEITVAALKDSGQIVLSGKEKSFTVHAAIPATGGETEWKTILLKNIKLDAGEQPLIITAAYGGFNLKEIRIKK